MKNPPHQAWPRPTALSHPLAKPWTIVLLLLAGLGSPILAAERVWDGTGRSSNWSQAANWTGGVPVAGDDLRFPAGALKPSNQNDFPAGTVFNQIHYTGAGYTASGNEIALRAGILVSHGAGATFFNLPITLEDALTQTFRVVESGATLWLTGDLSLGRGRGGLTVDGAGQVIVVGNISGTGLLGGLPGSTVRKTGPGTLYFLQHATYSGSTLVNGGTLRVDSSLSNSTVVLNDGATLRGTGKVGGLTANSGSAISPGGSTSPDSLDVLGDLVLNNGSTLHLRLNGTTAGLYYDQLDVRGTVTLAGTLDLAVGYAPDIGDTFLLIENDGTEPVNGTFNGLPEGTKFMLGAAEYTITYRGGTGNDVVLRHGLPLWRFTVLAAVSDETVMHYGGLGAVGTLISNQIAIVNMRFNDPKVFEGHFRFVVTSVIEFSGNPLNQLSDHPDHDFKVIYDAFPEQGGGWYGDVRTIHHSWAADNFDGPFAAYATDGLVHEFGHSRGAIDLYGLNVTATNNPISHQAFSAVTSIMHYPYGIHTWDEHSQHLINRNANIVAPDIRYITDAFPRSIRIRVRDADGNPFPNVLIKLFPVPWFSTSVSSTAVLSGETDDTGQLLLASNPFDPHTSNRPWNIRYPNFLVSAQYLSARAYAWMPLYDVQNSYFEAAFRGFLLDLQLDVGTFDSWRIARFSPEDLPNEALSGLFADPDLDGLYNLMEYALALDPLRADAEATLTYAVEGGDFVASYTRRKLSRAIDLTFLHQVSRNLRGGWIDVSNAQVIDQGTTELVRFRQPFTQSPEAFFRLQVSHQP